MCSLVGPFARWLVAASFSWSPCRAGRQTTHGTVAIGRMTAGRMAAAAAVAGKLMVEAGCTASCRPQTAGVYVPAQARPPGIQAVGLTAAAAAVGIAGRSSSMLASVSRQFRGSSH